jgi:ElaB/YqjD/DUF883 family membrane-anchored ribosome-binding protein
VTAVQLEITMNPDTQNEKSSARENTHVRIDRAAERTKQSASDVVGGATDKVDTAADRIEKGLHHAVNAGAHGAHRVADKAGEWRDRGAELASEARNRADQAAENLRERVREKPVQSVAVALALGWLVGRLLRPHN